MSRKHRFVSDKYFECDRCLQSVPAYYILSLLTKALWVQCPTCGLHARKYVEGLDLPNKPSKDYMKKTNTERKDYEGFIIKPPKGLEKISLFG